MARLAIVALAAGLASQQPDFEPLYRQALHEREQSLGRTALKTRESARDLGLYLASKGDLKNAGPYLADAMDLASHLPDAAALHNWAVALEREDPGKSEAMYRRVIAIRSKALPPLDPDLAVTRLNLSLLLIARGESEAAQLASAALRAFETRPPKFGAHIGAACGVLGAAAAIKGDVASAEKFFRRALAMSEKAHGPTAQETASALENLADLLSQTGRSSAARPLLDRAQGIRTNTREAVSPDPVVRERKVH